MRMSRPLKQSYVWKRVALVVAVCVFALWTYRLLNVPLRTSVGIQPSPQQHMASRATEKSSSYTSKVWVLLSTHNRLYWYCPDTDEDVPLHSGRGVYYGAFPGEPDAEGSPTLWVVSRPHALSGTPGNDALLHLHANSGALLGEVQLASRFTHDAIRRHDKVYVCNTGEGSILQLSYPSMAEIGRLRTFTQREHVNTVAAYDDSSVWAVLHNLGKSQVARVDVASGEVLQRFKDVGINSHGLVAWRGQFVMLSSQAAEVVLLDPVHGNTTAVWSSPPAFLKGLMVVGDVALFGITAPMSNQRRDALTAACGLVAVNLPTGRELYQRELRGEGLVNVVSTPHLSQASTYVAVNGTAPIASF
eukprot:jgi/Ulvmu1/55/UM001_0058.1